MALTYQAAWENVVSQYPPAMIEFVGGASIQYIGALAGAAATIYLKPQLRPAITKTLPLALFNITLGALIHILCLTYLSYKTNKPFLTTSLTTISPSLPNLPTMLSTFIQGLILYDAFFYTVHWALHQEPLYHHLHSWHHGIKDNVPTAGYYNHPLEHVLVHMVGPFWIPVLVNAHVLAFFAAGVWYLVSAQVVHSGLDMPYMNS